MLNLVDMLGIACIYLGVLCCFVASIGLFYFPNVFTRMHATAVTDTLGAGLTLVGLMLYVGWSYTLGKLLLILLFTLVTSPTISYVLANTALKHVSSDKNRPDVITTNNKGVGTSNR